MMAQASGIEPFTKMQAQSAAGRDLADLAPAHRACLWRYVKLHGDGGKDLDIKMALAQPLRPLIPSLGVEV